MAVARYDMRTMPQAAEVAAPAPSQLKSVVGFANESAQPVLAKLDQEARALEAAALNSAQRQLAAEGQQLEIKAQTEAGTAGDGYVPSVQLGRQALQKKVWETLPKSVQQSARAKAAFDEIWTADDMAATHRAVAWQTDQRVAYAERSLEDGLKAIEASVEENPETGAAQLEFWRKQVPTFGGLLTAEQLAKAEELGFQRLMLANVRGLAKKGQFDEADALVAKVAAGLGIQDRAAFEAEIEQERGKAQQENAEEIELGVLDETMTREDIDAAVAEKRITQGQGNILRRQRIAVVEKAEAEVKRARAEAQAAELARQSANAESLEYGILTGNAVEADVHLALDAGLIKQSQANTLVRQAREGSGKASKAQRVLDLRTLGVPLDPYDADTREGLDALWEAGGGAAAFTQEQEITKADGAPAGYKVNKGTMAVLGAAREAGVVPPAAASSLQGMATNGTDDQRITAFDTVAQLWAANPGAARAAFPETADRVLKDALSWQQKTKAGIDPVEALRAVERENEIPADPVLKARKAEATKKAAGLTTDGLWKSFDAGGLFSFVPFVDDAPGFAPGAEAEVLSMYQEAYETEFLRTGNDAVSQLTAMASVKRVMGVTNVGAGRTLMPYAPESFYAPGLQQQAPNWLNEDLVGGVTELVEGGLIPGAPKGTPVLAADLRIIPDGETARAVREQQPPSYVVEWRGEVIDQRWRFDPTRPLKAAELKGELDALEQKRVGEVKRAFAQGGWDEKKTGAAYAALKDAKSADDYERMGNSTLMTLGKGPKAVKAAELFGTVGAINQRYANEAQTLTSLMNGAAPQPKVVGAERITPGSR